ncbi:PadR family transcriptional regulator [Streptomyces sp. NPDC000594]|uniref:PadR family transcriptional regulator n=1 Tax=Streptomyces sp. NPDC000594 TaxID=3154261 RepID=UPI003319F34E
MPPVFAHGRLRLYLLKLLDESPRHGYEVIRLLEERFHGLYAPSAGTVYPRLAKLEAEGLVTHTTEGGRKVYSLTDTGREELARRGGELAVLELEIREAVAELAAEIREDAQQARREMQRITRELQEQVQDHFARGDWPSGIREGLSELTARLSGLSQQGMAWMTEKPEPEKRKKPEKQGEQERPEPSATAGTAPQAEAETEAGTEAAAGAGWAGDIPATGDPARDLERLLDRFRDDIRDAARDHGVSGPQLAGAHRRLAEAATGIVASLTHPGGTTGTGTVG